MDGMFDHDHDGKLSANERMERDFFITEIVDHSEHLPRHNRSSASDHAGAKLLGVLFLLTGVNAFIYFPIFALIMIGLAICFLAQ